MSEKKARREGEERKARIGKQMKQETEKVSLARPTPRATEGIAQDKVSEKGEESEELISRNVARSSRSSKPPGDVRINLVTYNLSPPTVYRLSVPNLESTPQFLMRFPCTSPPKRSELYFLHLLHHFS